MYLFISSHSVTSTSVRPYILLWHFLNLWWMSEDQRRLQHPTPDHQQCEHRQPGSLWDCECFKCTYGGVHLCENKIWVSRANSKYFFGIIQALRCPTCFNDALTSFKQQILLVLGLWYSIIRWIEAFNVLLCSHLCSLWHLFSELWNWWSLISHFVHK